MRLHGEAQLEMRGINLDHYPNNIQAPPPKGSKFTFVVPCT